MEQLRDIYSRLRRMIGFGHIRLTDEDGAVQPRVQLEFGPGGPPELNEVIDDVIRMAHYGLYYRPPTGSEAVVIFLGGNRSNAVVINTGHRESRPADLEEGEVMLSNTQTGAYVRFSADGKIRSKGDWLHDGFFKATGDVLDHSADNTATMKVHRDQYNAHKHGGVTAGGALTAVTDDTAP